eukprot:4448403-Amphidinium_carterae.3
MSGPRPPRVDGLITSSDASTIGGGCCASSGAHPASLCLGCPCLYKDSCIVSRAKKPARWSGRAGRESALLGLLSELSGFCRAGIDVVTGEDVERWEIHGFCFLVEHFAWKYLLVHDTLHCDLKRGELLVLRREKLMGFDVGYTSAASKKPGDEWAEFVQRSLVGQSLCVPVLV